MRTCADENIKSKGPSVVQGYFGLASPAAFYTKIAPLCNRLHMIDVTGIFRVGIDEQFVSLHLPANEALLMTIADNRL